MCSVMCMQHYHLHRSFDVGLCGKSYINREALRRKGHLAQVARRQWMWRQGWAN